MHVQAVAVVEKEAKAANSKPSSQYELYTLTTWLLKVICSATSQANISPRDLRA